MPAPPRRRRPASTVAQLHETDALERARDADRVLAPLEAEAKALSRILAPGTALSRSKGPALLSQLRVKPGFEKAVAALFEGELAAPLISTRKKAPKNTTGAGWIALLACEAVPLPDSANPLADAVAGPAVLARRLAHSGWVENAAEGWRLQPLLKPGQVLADRDGNLWRWDGFVRIGAAASGAAELLRQRNRLDRLEGEIEAARRQADLAAVEAARSRAARENAAAAEREAAGAGARRRRASWRGRAGTRPSCRGTGSRLRQSWPPLARRSTSRCRSRRAGAEPTRPRRAGAAGGPGRSPRGARQGALRDRRGATSGRRSARRA